MNNQIKKEIKNLSLLDLYILEKLINQEFIKKGFSDRLNFNIEMKGGIKEYDDN